ncbi:transposase [Bradyrhizobium sp. BRP22]|uniref:transposase n=1 Tax=Bradyrhizobium sp. BRP22 TaxID=2793821 RepID=UPI001CD6DBCA|nr:transposase [Bradyrhizobium sp. BRP22]MCA1458800.1 transposase [Bradyrhizobium sp. BRP22]
MANVGDGGLDLYKALDEVFPSTRRPRCWAHKTVNVLHKFSLSVQAAMQEGVARGLLGASRASAEAVINLIAEKHCAKYGQAVRCLVKDRDALLAFYDFLVERWDHFRTTNAIESVFVNGRYRTVRTRGSLLPTISDAVQAGDRCIKDLAAAESHKSVAEGHRSCRTRRRH